MSTIYSNLPSVRLSEPSFHRLGWLDPSLRPLLHPFVNHCGRLRRLRLRRAAAGRCGRQKNWQKISLHFGPLRDFDRKPHLNVWVSDPPSPPSSHSTAGSFVFYANTIHTHATMTKSAMIMIRMIQSVRQLLAGSAV